MIHLPRSDMVQNFWIAITAWTTCMVVTIAISLATRPKKSPDQLKGLVYSLTPRILSDDEPWYQRPAVLGVLVLLAVIALNIIFM
jgi:SSS family solute:Na+ symporter